MFIPFFFAISFAQAASSVSGKVYVAAQYASGSVIYTYTITNTGSEPISEFTIGASYNRSLGISIPTLREMPWGTVEGEVSPLHGNNRTEYFVLTADRVKNPSGWLPSFYGTDSEDHEGNYFLAWEADDGHEIMPGNSLAGFSVEVPFINHAKRKIISEKVLQKPYTEDSCYLGDINYVLGPVILGRQYSTSPPDLTGFQEVTPLKFDFVAPQLSVTASPSKIFSPTEKFVSVHLQVSSADDSYGNVPYDCLLSITANQDIDLNADVQNALIGQPSTDFSLRATLGIAEAARRGAVEAKTRIYYINYVSTDASGNRTLSTINIPVSLTP